MKFVRIADGSWTNILSILKTIHLLFLITITKATFMFNITLYYRLIYKCNAGIDTKTEIWELNGRLSLN